MFYVVEIKVITNSEGEHTTKLIKEVEAESITEAAQKVAELL